MIDEAKKLLPEALSCAVRGKTIPASASLERNRWDLYELAMEHRVLPLVVDALHEESDEAHPKPGIEEEARRIVILQAQRTADFLLLLRALKEQGLRPCVVKGLICRSLYPKPELRPSSDEDLLIPPEEYPAYVEVLAANGYRPEKSDAAETDYEIAFSHPDSHLYLELHTSLFPADSEAYGNCARYFEGALDRAVDLTLEGVPVRTLAPTDHLLFLICHAFKHLLYGGVGIRQLCDMALMAERFDDEIDWPYVRRACDELDISVFTAAIFRICERQLGFSMPDAFSDLSVDESALLEDVLSGGLYGVVDVDRAHSSTMTLEAVSADRSGRRAKGALHSVFLPLKSMQGPFPYLRRYPWLLPAAWVQRIFRYLTRKSRPDPVKPSRSIQIARERIELLRQYRIIK